MPLEKGTYDPTRFNAVYLANQFSRFWLGLPLESLSDRLRKSLVDSFQDMLDTAMDEGVIQ